MVPPLVTRHTYSPESAAVTCSSRSREPDTCGEGTRGPFGLPWGYQSLHGATWACMGHQNLLRLPGLAWGHQSFHGLPRLA